MAHMPEVVDAAARPNEGVSEPIAQNTNELSGLHDELFV